MSRDVLYDRIDRRVDRMIADGLEREARELYPLREYNALQTVGYRELFAYFEGETSRERAIELIKRNSRRYAKRQTTWFRKEYGHAMVRSRRRVRRKNRRLSERDDMTAAPLLSDKQIDTA